MGALLSQLGDPIGPVLDSTGPVKDPTEPVGDRTGSFGGPAGPDGDFTELGCYFGQLATHFPKKNARNTRFTKYRNTV